MNSKFKSEQYQLFGGINQKISQYDTPAFEFLDLKNYDFQLPGALSQRWGSTQYVGQGFSAPITSIFEFQRLGGESFVFVGTTGALWYGATTGQSQGVSLTALSATIGVAANSNGSGNFTKLFVDQLLPGGTFIVKSSGFILNYKNNPKLRVTSGGATSMRIAPQIFSTNVISQAVIGNNQFLAAGNIFLRFDGSTFYPAVPVNPFVVNGGGTFLNTPTITKGVDGSNGLWSFYASYVNNRGFETEIVPICFLNLDQVGFSYHPGSFGGSFVQAFVDLYTPSAYGISSINIYSYFSPTTIPQADLVQNKGYDFWFQNYVFAYSEAVAGETTRIFLGATLVNSATTQLFLQDMKNNLGAVPDTKLKDRFYFGMTMSGNDTAFYRYNSVFPSIIESHANRLFAAGMTGLQSTVFFSDLIEPQGFNIENSFEARTNDGDIISGMKSYQNNKLCIGKRNSFHVLFGDDETNFFLQEASGVYGVLNQKSFALFKDYIAFLDKKGICVYDGARVQLMSDKVQPIFDRMNLSAAVNTACMTNDKARSQILCGIPVDGATLNNITVVYDYLANAWTTYDGFTPSVFAEIQGRNNNKNVFYGTPSGVVNWFGPSFINDNAVGVSTYFKTKFFKDMGDSVQKQWRRLYLNGDVGGATHVMALNFYQDYGSSRVLQSTFVLSQFQDRYEFGISSKSLAFELHNYQTSTAFKLFGFTVESRMQRKV